MLWHVSVSYFLLLLNRIPSQVFLLSTLCFISILFYRRPTLLPVFANQTNPREIFTFAKRVQNLLCRGALNTISTTPGSKVSTASSLSQELPQHQAPIALNCVCKHLYFELVSSVAQLCLTLCDPMVFSMPGFSPGACSNSCQH